MEPDTPLSPAVRRLITGLLTVGMATLWLLDLVNVDDSDGSPLQVLMLVFGTLTALALLSPGRPPAPAIRAGIAAPGSLAFTAVSLIGTRAEFSWGLLETTALLGLLVRTARRTRRPAAAVALSAALGVAVIALPLRVSTDYETLTFSFLLTFAVGGAVGLGCYLRLLDARRARAMTAVRHNERLELARDLHDFVAHHVTGIIVHANAALMIQESSPEHVKPLLEGISRAGSETLDSMRRLVRVLREDDHQAARPGELLTELDRLVCAFAGARHRGDAGRRVRGARDAAGTRGGDVRPPGGAGGADERTAPRSRRGCGRPPGDRPGQKRQLAAGGGAQHRPQRALQRPDGRPERLRPGRAPRTGGGRGRLPDQRPDTGRRLVRAGRLPRSAGRGRITGKNSGSDVNGASGARTKVLIADDQDMVRTGFRLILGTQPDLEVVGEAADGAECVELARRLRPDVCLADIRMPRLDGLEVTRALAGPGVTDPLRVVLVTTFDQDDYAYTALRNGACGFLLKDAASNLLIEAVRSAARGDALVSPAVTVRLLKHLAAHQPTPPAPHPLSERELDVVRLLAVGRTNQEI